jgi:hypothetical protein
VSNWKDEDIATPDLIKEYLKEFEAGMQENPRYQLSEGEKLKVRESLDATEKFCLGILSGKKRMYMHDLILMAVGYYGGYLTALDALKKQG